MEAGLIRIKKELLKRITILQYGELLSFMEKIYLDDSNLKIVKARKFSNLFFTLSELALAENGGRIRELCKKKFAGKDPVIISDRALEYYYEEICRHAQDETYKILIVDDIVIHGRTINSIYKKIQSWLGENKISFKIQAYIMNEQDTLKEQHVQDVEAQRYASVGECRAYSKMMVDIFYLKGRPCTSYVPNIVLSTETTAGKTVDNLLQKYIETREAVPLRGEEHSFMKTMAYSWVDSKGYDFTCFQSLRFYQNSVKNQLRVIPMVSLRPMSRELLDGYMTKLRGYVNKAFDLILDGDDSIYGDMKNRIVVYVVSALWGRMILLENGILPEWNIRSSQEEEWINFGRYLLEWDFINQLCVTELKALFNCLNEEYVKCKRLDSKAVLACSDDFQLLQECLEELNCSTGDAKDFIYRYLTANGDLDEKRWAEGKQKNDIPDRLVGYPVTLLFDYMVSKQYSYKDIVNAILRAIDFAEGAIIARSFSKDGQTYFISVIYNGEQSYQYLERKYLAYMYGLYLIETKAENETKILCEKKNAFSKLYINYLNNSGQVCDEEEITSLCKKNIVQGYKQVLLRDISSYYDRKRLAEAAALADKVLKD